MMNTQQVVINIGGIVPFSTIDYPTHLAAVIFCQGCTFNCRYCHNPNLIPNYNNTHYTWQKIQALLANRKKLLEAVVFSGGEPLIHKDLYKAMFILKSMGYKIGLHTSGVFPAKIKKILLLLDWIGMDIKAPFHQYEHITTVPNSGKYIAKSIELVLTSGIAYEFRTTVHPKLLSTQQVLEIAKELKSLGANNYTIQQFRALGCKDQDLCAWNGGDFLDGELISDLRKQFNSFKVV